MPVRRVMPMLVVLVLDRHRTLQIDDRQQTKMKACRPPVIRPRNIIGSGMRNGTRLKRISDDQLFAEDVAEKP